MAAPSGSLLDVPTMLRTLRSDEAPYPGRLHSGDPQMVWVDHALVPEVAWRCDPAGHILAPHDVGRTDAGHVAVVRHCPHRLGEVVRAVREAGEAVTVAVSILRAAQEARAAEFDTGTWWLDTTCRPVLAPGGGRDWVEEAVALLADLTAPMSRHSGRRDLIPVLDEVTRLLRSVRWSGGELEACEEALFACAEPVPLVATVALALGAGADAGELPPRRADSLRREHAPGRGTATLLEHPASRMATWVARFSDHDTAERVRGAVHSVADRRRAIRERRRTRREVSAGRPARRDHGGPAGGRGDRPPPSRRRAPLVVAAAVGLAVVIGGLLWPGPAGPEATARTQTVVIETAAASPSAQVTDEQLPSGGESGAVAPVTGGAATGDESGAEQAARSLIRELSDCAAVSTGCSALLEDENAPLPAGLAAMSGRAVAVTMLDEYGGAASFRVEADGVPTQILVLVSADGKWLVRSAYDVADQP